MKNLILSIAIFTLPLVGFAQSGCVSGDCIDGFGTFRFGTNDVYIGQFRGGKQQGQGTFLWASGEKYEGQWKDGMQNGFATFTWRDGVVQTGLWENGSLKREMTADQYDAALAGNSTTTLPTKQTTTAPPKQSPAVVKSEPKPIVTNTASVPTPNDGPQIQITSPQVTRGFVVSTAIEKIDVTGTASDKDGIQQVRINGSVAWLSAPNKTKTNFQLPITLVAGQNKIWIEAKDLAGNTSNDEFVIDRSVPNKVADNGGTKPKAKKNTDVKPVASTQPTGSKFRTALIIGNSKYEGGLMLRNSRNDADSLTQELTRQGWEVMSYADLNQEDMEGAISQFGEKIKQKGGAGLFYYAGHGVQMDGNNYLIPVKAPIKKQADFRYKAVNLGTVLDAMNDAGNKMNIVILDACRDNPFAENGRSLKKGDGLAPIDNAPPGTFIAYATSPGKSASDGAGANGLYTQELLKAIRIKDLTIEEVFKKVRKNVRQLSGGAQIPWDSSSLEEKFIFRK